MRMVACLLLLSPLDVRYSAKRTILENKIPRTRIFQERVVQNGCSKQHIPVHSFSDMRHWRITHDVACVEHVWEGYLIKGNTRSAVGGTGTSPRSTDVGLPTAVKHIGQEIEMLWKKALAR